MSKKKDKDIIYILMFIVCALIISLLLLCLTLSITLNRSELFIKEIANSLSWEQNRYTTANPKHKWLWEKRKGLSSETEYMSPVSVGYVSSRYGWRSIFRRVHYGLDIAVPVGTPILASKDGIVTYSGYGGNYGILVTLHHDDGSETRYGHCSSVVVAEGDIISQGEVIAFSGNTGRSTGPHLHFEIRINGSPVDPEIFLCEAM